MGTSFFLPSELEDDLLGEDLLSGKKVRTTDLPETKGGRLITLKV